MPIFIPILTFFIVLPLFSQNISDTTNVLKRPAEKKERRPMLRRDETVDPNMPMIPGNETVDPNMPMLPKSDFIAVDKQPVPIKEVKPVFPQLGGVRKKIEGTVWVKVLIDKQGKVKKAEIMKSDAEILNKPTLDAARQWIFKPAMRNNKPVEVWTGIRIKFKVNTK